MVFSIVIILLVAAVAFFHYVQGFFSATISAVLSVISAVIAVSYYESIVEGPLAGIMVNWMPSLVLLGLFAIIYTVLRTFFDKAVPGSLQVPAVVDKVGGAVMGLVAGCFGVGVVALAAQQMPFGPSIAGYTRYEVQGNKAANVPTGVINARAKEANTYDEMNDVRFEPDKETMMYVPVDDILVGTVKRLSDGGALNRGKPLASVHPNLLTELFGLRLGIESGAVRSAGNYKGKNQVEVVSAFEAPPLEDAKIIDHEMTKIRAGTTVKAPALLPGERRIVVRARVSPDAADTKDKRIRLSPGAVRIVAKDVDDATNEMAYRNYFPIGTLDPDGRLYVNKIDDFLLIDTQAKKTVGDGTGPAEVDFVFQVKENGFFTKGDPQRIEDGVFFEFKKFARIDLAGDAGAVKKWTPLQVFAIKRKHLEWEPGRESQTSIEYTKGAKPAPGPQTEFAAGGGGALGQRLVGTWESKGVPGSGGDETYTFTAEGGLTTKAAELRWVASGPPQGETLVIKAAPAGKDPATGGALTIAFVDNDTFNATTAAGASRRFVRSGSAAANTPPAPTPEQLMEKLAGTWENGEGFRYVFRADGTYTLSLGEKSNEGKWKVIDADKDIMNVELNSTKTGSKSMVQWDVTDRESGEISRLSPSSATAFKRKS